MQDNFIHIAYDAFLEKAAADDSVNFIAFVITPWHAISLDASIQYLKSRGVNLNGMVLIYPHDITGVNVTRSSFMGENYTLYVEDNLTPNECKSKSNKSNNKLTAFLRRRRTHLSFYAYVLFGRFNWRKLPQIYLMETVYPAPLLGLRFLGMGRYTKYVCFDEGIGTYTPYNDIAPKSRDIRAWHKYFREAIVGHRWMNYFHDVTQTMLLREKDSKLYPRTEVLPFYRNVITHHASNFSKNRCDLSNAIIIATSTYYEEIDYYHGEDVRILEKVCGLLHNMGCELYMKQHPRDTYFRQFAEQWHCKLIDESYQSIETLCAISKPKCIIGGPSTALVTSNLLYNIPALCIYDLMNQELCSELIKGEVRSYKKLFVNFIQCPQNINELRNIVSQIYMK